MAEAESSTDQRMCKGTEGVVVEDAALLLVWELQASSLNGRYPSKERYLILFALNEVMNVKSLYSSSDLREDVPPRLRWCSPLFLFHPSFCLPIQNKSSDSSCAYFNFSRLPFVFFLFISVRPYLRPSAWSYSSHTRLGADRLLIVPVVMYPW